MKGKVKKMPALKGKIWIIPEEVNTQNFYKEVMIGDNFNTGIREFVSKYQLSLEVGDNSFVSSYLLASCGYLVVLDDLIEKDTSIYIPASVSPRQLNFINENKLELMKNKVNGYEVTDSDNGYHHFTSALEIIDVITNKSMGRKNKKR